MKGGQVVNIRVPPKDVMTCIDLVQKAGLVTAGMSLSECIRLALSGLCGGARNAGLVPDRDGFEYDQMVQPFKSYNQAKKLAIAREVSADMARREVNDYAPKGKPIGDMAFTPRPPLDSMRRRQLRAREKELKFKQEHDPINFTEEDRRELERVISEDMGLPS